MTTPPSEPQSKPDERKEPRKKTDAEKQQEKDAMINLWIGNMEPNKDDSNKA